MCPLGDAADHGGREGSLESSKNQDAFCLVEGGTTIIMIKPEGTRVKKGEVVCELDSAALNDQLDESEDHDRERQGQLRATPR